MSKLLPTLAASGCLFCIQAGLLAGNDTQVNSMEYKIIEIDESYEALIQVVMIIPNFQDFGKRRSFLCAMDDDDHANSMKDLERYLIKDPNFKPDEVEIALPENSKWTNKQEAAFLKFLQAWPEVRDKLPEEALRYYREKRADQVKYSAKPETEWDAWTNFCWPDTDDPKVGAELFEVTRVHLREDGRYGLECEATWGTFGVLIKDNTVVEVNYLDIAYE